MFDSPNEHVSIKVTTHCTLHCTALSHCCPTVPQSTQRCPLSNVAAAAVTTASPASPSESVEWIIVAGRSLWQTRLACLVASTTPASTPVPGITSTHSGEQDSEREGGSVAKTLTSSLSPPPVCVCVCVSHVTAKSPAWFMSPPKEKCRGCCVSTRRAPPSCPCPLLYSLHHASCQSKWQLLLLLRQVVVNFWGK